MTTVTHNGDFNGKEGRPTPWQVRATLVRVLSEVDGAGLTISEVERRVADGLGVPLVDPIEADITSLQELGVITEVSGDDRRLSATDAAERYLLGSEIVSPG